MTEQRNGPLSGLVVVDFSTLLPGPLATAMLVEAGADVIKVERPGSGDEMRAFEPRFDGESAIFALLNQGKRSIALDLKNPEDNATARRLALEADIVIEQFRPGVMERLGLSYEALSKLNPKLIYCSITGYGQTGPKAQRAAHDLNYVAEAGMLSLVTSESGAPSLPPIPVADIGGGAYPAFMNIMLALYQRHTTGMGAYLDISMTDNIFPFLYWAMAGVMSGQPPRPGAELITGGSPRYAIYRTADNAFLAAAPMEDRFWNIFCAALDLPVEADQAMVAERIGGLDSSLLRERLVPIDSCCSIVDTMEQAMADPHVISRGLFQKSAAGSIDLLPLPFAPIYRSQNRTSGAPLLNEHSKYL